MSKKTAIPGKPENHLAVFQEKAIRRTWHNEEWWFSVADVCGVLTDSPDAGAYWRKLKQRLVTEASEVVTFCHGLKLEAPDGKQRVTDCANTEGLFRIIQSIPSPKAEPFKRWLAKVGYERVKEIENPELAAARMRELYKAKGYSDDWIEKRVRGIAIRDELTNEWNKRGVKEQREYSILTGMAGMQSLKMNLPCPFAPSPPLPHRERGQTNRCASFTLIAEISRATFGMTPAEYKAFKSLEKPTDILRDHMNDLELIFSMLGKLQPLKLPAIKTRRALMKTAARPWMAEQWQGVHGAIWRKNQGSV